MAPIDIVIDIIKRNKQQCLAAREDSRRDNACNESYFDGCLDTMEDLMSTFEGFKKLFN